MPTAPTITISHVSFHCFDLDAMVDFYTRVLGFRLTDRGKMRGDKDIAFLSGDARDHHQREVPLGGAQAAQDVGEAVRDRQGHGGQDLAGPQPQAVEGENIQDLERSPTLRRNWSMSSAST